MLSKVRQYEINETHNCRRDLAQDSAERWPRLWLLILALSNTTFELSKNTAYLGPTSDSDLLVGEWVLGVYVVFLKCRSLLFLTARIKKQGIQFLSHSILSHAPTPTPCSGHSEASQANSTWTWEQIVVWMSVNYNWWYTHHYLLSGACGGR